MKNDSVYLSNTPLSEAKELWHQALESCDFFSPKTTSVAVDDALGETTAGPVYAQHSSPSYNASAMDGVAVCFQDLAGASESSPIRLAQKKYLPVNTGNAVPEPYNAVVMIEDVHQLDNQEIELIHPATPWQHVRTVGEDIVATELIIPQGHVIRPIDQGALLAAGITEVEKRAVKESAIHAKRFAAMLEKLGPEAEEPLVYEDTGAFSPDMSKRLESEMLDEYQLVLQHLRHAFVFEDESCPVSSGLELTAMRHMKHLSHFAEELAESGHTLDFVHPEIDMSTSVEAALESDLELTHGARKRFIELGRSPELITKLVELLLGFRRAHLVADIDTGQGIGPVNALGCIQVEGKSFIPGLCIGHFPVSPRFNMFTDIIEIVTPFKIRIGAVCFHQALLTVIDPERAVCTVHRAKKSGTDGAKFGDHIEVFAEYIAFGKIKGKEGKIEQSSGIGQQL